MAHSAKRGALRASAPGYLVATHQNVAHATSSDDGANRSEPGIIWVSVGGAAVWINDREGSAYDLEPGRAATLR